MLDTYHFPFTNSKPTHRLKPINYDYGIFNIFVQEKHSMHQPTISIIVPCYNQAQYLDECLQSVFDQIYQNWECIIVNDGSPDNTEEIAIKWIEKDQRFKYLKKENNGVASARNSGIEIAKGEWILPLDGDDKIGNLYLKLAAQEFHKGYKVIYCEADFFGNVNEKFNLAEYDFKKILLHNSIFCSAFFKKNTWSSEKGYDQNLKSGLEDWDYWLTILDKNSRVLKLNYKGFFYRRKLNSRDTEINADLSKLRDAKNYIYKKHFDKYIQEYPNFFELHDEICQLKQNNDSLLTLVNEPLIKKIKRKIFR